MKNQHEIKFTWTARRKGSTPAIATWYVNYDDHHLAFHFSPDYSIQWFEKNCNRIDQSQMSNLDFIMSIKLIKARDLKFPIKKYET